MATKNGKGSTGSGVESGLTRRESFHSTTPEALGMGYVEGSQKPKGPKERKASRGHKLR